MVTVDNNGYTSSNKVEEVEKLDLTAWYGEYTAYTYSGVHITATDGVRYISNYLGRIGITGAYIANVAETTVTLTLPHVLFVDHIRVFPYCSG